MWAMAQSVTFFMMLSTTRVSRCGGAVKKPAQMYCKRAAWRGSVMIVGKEEVADGFNVRKYGMSMHRRGEGKGVRMRS